MTKPRTVGCRKRKAAVRLRAGRRRARRGMAVVLVLGLLAITLALSYSMLRGQATTIAMQRNYSRSADARYAAHAGMAAALRKMHENEWSGVDTTLQANLGANTWYEARYTTGDASLTSSSPDWAEYPFRVTIRVTGYASDPSQPGVRSSHSLEAVAQLSRRALNNVPASWTSAQSFSLYQWENDDVRVEIPFRAEGNVCLLGRLRLCEDYPPSTQRQQYLTDLNRMRLAGLGDHRPFSGPVTLNLGRQSSTTLSQLQVQLGLSTNHTGAASTQPVASPGAVAKYRLYRGGAEYAVPSLQQQYGLLVQNVTLGTDPKTNPLGIYRSEGFIALGNNARITGTVISDGASADFYIGGTGVQLKGANLPALEGSSQARQLPVLLVRDDLFIYPDSTSTVEGATVVWDEFNIPEGSKATQFALRGKLFASGLEVGGREEWDLSDGQWNSSYNHFTDQLFPFRPWTVWFYPQWMQYGYGTNYEPQLTVKPNSDGVQYHWHDWTQPVYVPAAGDVGLKWNVVSYRSVSE